MYLAFFMHILCITKASVIFQLKINVFMGRGDKKTKKGKIFKGSFGKSRPSRPEEAAKKIAAKSAPKKEA